MKRRGLGRGLDALLPSTPVEGAYREVPVERLTPNPEQPRSAPESADLEGLAASIASQGVIEPVVVRESADGFEIVAGERRWRAARQAGLQTIPVVVREVPDGNRALLALVENLQRQNLNPVEEAVAFRRLATDGGLTHDRIAREVGRSRAAVTNALRLLELSPEVRRLIESGRLRAAAGRAMISLPAKAQQELAEAVVQGDLSVREVERRVKAAQRESGKKTRAGRVPKTDANTRAAEERMQHAAGLPVQIRRRGKGGEVRVRFFSEDDLHRVFVLLTATAEDEPNQE